MKRSLEHFRGCLLGGAIGDALGYPIEFMSNPEIQDLIPSTSGKAVISDDTQMTLFTAEGLLRAETMWKEQGTKNQTDHTIAFHLIRLKKLRILADYHLNSTILLKHATLYMYLSRVTFYFHFSQK
jgi:hypothetical protein